MEDENILFYPSAAWLAIVNGFLIYYWILSGTFFNWWLWMQLINGALTIGAVYYVVNYHMEE